MPKPTRVSCVELEDSVPTSPSHGLSVAAVQRQQGALMGILESMTKYLNLEERLSISRALQGTLSSRTDKESTGTPVICQKKDIMQGHVRAANCSRGRENRYLLCHVTGTGGCFTSPTENIFTVNSVTAF